MTGDPRWSVVIPVKGGSGKSRLGDDPRRAELAWAFAQDSVDATLAAASVAEVIVVSADPDTASRLFREARIVADPGLGLNAAVRAGLDLVRDPRTHRAVLLSDVPALTADELDQALDAASMVPRALVPDADGTGTVLTTALAGVRHSLRFGSGSRALHREAGYQELTFPPTWGLRRDVDLGEHLEELGPLRVGRHTRSVLSGSAALLHS